jgi:hypothetical protein
VTNKQGALGPEQHLSLLSTTKIRPCVF